MHIKKTILTIQEISEILPHRFPMLLIDGVQELQENTFIQVFKNIARNDFFFQGHFPSKSIYPGVLLLEAMAQAAGILVFKSINRIQVGTLFYLASISNAKFRSLVFPGDQIIIRIYLISMIKKAFSFNAVSTVQDKIVCESKILCIHN
ncbi:3-hydroxyacyl-ACP dehydratase FabZ [Buchnera aphidicola (Hormaphis cornu)]|nr:3-hydroxyacyl-ACP dehydratase FabZ [Buchnera aphidicola (Hormaphis cornu)]